jgi:GT2 family glycosyltransferase
MVGRKTMPDISVIVPAFNEERYLGATLAALLAARDDLRRAHGQIAELLVVDNGSTDGTAEIARDADTIVPAGFLCKVAEVMADDRVLAGAMDTEYRPRRLTMKLYLRLWRVLARLMRMGQGAGQFCRRATFAAVGGYDETLFMGEDVDFLWRVQRHGAPIGARTVVVRDLRVVPATRRFDLWPLWQVLLMTNPFVILLLRRRRTAWSGWCSREVR